MRRRVRRGLMAAYISSQRETRGSTDLCSLMAAAAPKRTARSCIRVRLGWVLGKGSSLRRVIRHQNTFCGAAVTAPRLLDFKKNFDNSQKCG